MRFPYLFIMPHGCRDVGHELFLLGFSSCRLNLFPFQLVQPGNENPRGALSVLRRSSGQATSLLVYMSWDGLTNERRARKGGRTLGLGDSRDCVRVGENEWE